MLIKMAVWEIGLDGDVESCLTLLWIDSFIIIIIIILIGSAEGEYGRERVVRL